MRITFLLGGLNMTGGTKVVSIYAEHLRRRGHEIQVVSRGERKPTLKSRLKSAMTRGVLSSPVTTPQSFFDNSNVNVIRTKDYGPITESDVPDSDVVVATWWETAEWMSQLGKSKGAKAHFIQCQEGYPLFKDRQRVDRTAALYKQPFSKITISKSLVLWLESQYGCDPRAITLIPNAVDTNQFHAKVRGKQEYPTVGFLYHFDPTKGVDVSLKALGIVSSKYHNLQILAFGSYHPTTERPLPDVVKFHFSPAQDQIRDIYSNCDVWLCGSRIEGFHLPPLEAMACRCPVVSTLVGGPDQIVQNGLNGFIVDVDDVNGLADRLMNVLNLCDNDWRAMSAAAFETTQGYTWEDATDRFEAALVNTVRDQ